MPWIFLCESISRPYAKEASLKSQHQQPISKSIVQLLDEIHADKQLKDAPKWSDGNKVRDGIIARAGERMVGYAAQYHLDAKDLEEKTAEMTNAVCYYTAGAQNPPHLVMYDFYFM